MGNQPAMEIGSLPEPNKERVSVVLELPHDKHKTCSMCEKPQHKVVNYHILTNVCWPCRRVISHGARRWDEEQLMTNIRGQKAAVQVFYLINSMRKRGNAKKRATMTRTYERTGRVTLRSKHRRFLPMLRAKKLRELGYPI